MAFLLTNTISSILLHPETRPALPNTSPDRGLRWSKDQQLRTDGGGDVGTTGPGALIEYNGLLWCIHPGKRGTGQEPYLCYTVFDGNKWSKDQQLKTESGGDVGTYGSPILAVFDGKLWCVHRGADNLRRDFEYLWYTVFDGSKWSEDKPLDHWLDKGVGTSAPAGLTAFNNRLYCVHTGGQNNSGDAAYLWYTVSNGNSWSKDEQLKTGGDGVVGTYGSPALAEYDGKLFCIHRGGDNISRHSEYLWYTVLDGNTWSKDEQLKTDGGGVIGATSPAEDWGADRFAPAALATFDGKLWCIHQGGGRDDDKDYLWYTVFDGNTWSTDQKVSYSISPSESAFVKISLPAALGVYKNQLFCTHEVDGYLLYFVVSGSSQSGRQVDWIKKLGHATFCENTGLLEKRDLTASTARPQVCVDTLEVLFNLCWFYGALRSRRLNNTEYGPVRIQLEDVPASSSSAFGHRPRVVQGVVMTIPVGNRDQTPNPSAGWNDRWNGGGVDRGHLFGLSLGGPDVPENIVPQWSNWQRNGQWREMERIVRARTAEVQDASRPLWGGAPQRSVFLRIEVIYPHTNLQSMRTWAFPSRFIVTAYVCDRQTGQEIQGVERIYNNTVFEGTPDNWNPEQVKRSLNHPNRNPPTF